MKKHNFKLVSEQRGQHVFTDVYAGFIEEGGTLANCGTLVMNTGEWQAFGALLLLGAHDTAGRIIVTMEGDEEIVSREEE